MSAIRFGNRVALAVVIVIGVNAGIVLTLFLQPMPPPPGAALLTNPTPRAAAPHDIPASYVPLHKGHVDPGTGRYVREDDDLILRRTPGFVLRRTYVSKDRTARQFGVGTTSNAEWNLIGDAQAFSWAELVLADRSGVHFERVTPGTTFRDAMFVAKHMPFQRSTLGWTGEDWALRFEDGALARFLPCGPDRALCALTLLRDADGHAMEFQRDQRGRLRRIQGPDEFVDILYDNDGDRVTAITDASGRRVTYAYDTAGRLTRVDERNGTARVYTYSANDEMLTVLEPGWFIENTFENGRLVRQATTTAGPPVDGRSPRRVEMTMAYTVVKDEVTETRVREYDGTVTFKRYDSDHHVAFEIEDAEGASPMTVQYDRDPAAHDVTTLTVRCTVKGRRVVETARVERDLDSTRTLLIARACLDVRPLPRADRASIEKTRWRVAPG